MLTILLIVLVTGACVGGIDGGLVVTLEPTRVTTIHGRSIYSHGDCSILQSNGLAAHCRHCTNPAWHEMGLGLFRYDARRFAHLRWRGHLWCD